MPSFPRLSSINVQAITGYKSLGDVASPGTGVSVTEKLLALLTSNIPVLIPPGVWTVTPFTMPANACIFGVGVSSQLKLKTASNAPGIVMSNGSSVRDVLFDANKSSQSGANLHGISITGVSSVTLEGVTVKDARGSGIRVSGASSEVRIAHCTVTGQTENGIYISAGNNMFLHNITVFSSDVIASGDGVAIKSDGAAITNITLSDSRIYSNAGRGVLIAGQGSRNVTDVLLSNTVVSGNVSHNLQLSYAERISITTCIFDSSSGDGVRFDGDVQNCRLSNVISKLNVSYGIREVISGATPNNNGFIYSITAGNGNNTITKVGGASFIV